MIILKTQDLNLFYGKFQALSDVNLSVVKNKITAFIGPSGCGKSTLLRCLNRMNDLIEGTRTTGNVIVNGENIYGKDTDLTKLRKKIGMVFQRPNPFPLSVFDNCVYGPRVHGITDKKKLEEIAYQSLLSVSLWDEVKDRLNEPAFILTEEQKQRLCIARLLAVDAQVLLMDEPCSALDPVATQNIEKLLIKLKKKVTVVIVTHNMQQAARISDYTGFFLLGKMLEFGRTTQIFTNPKDIRTEEYIEGKYG